MSEQVFVYDCTLRDGTQGEDVSLSVADKIRIAQRLDDFGVHYIEGGWPGSNPTDVEFFKRAASLKWKRSKICAFGSTRHFKYRVDQDPNLKALLEAHTPVLTIVAKGWDFHVEKVLGVSLEENLTLIRESLTYLKDRGKEIVFDAEHFFDGYAHNPEYALQVLAVAQEAGADWIVLCDTRGGALSSAVQEITREVAQRFDRVGIHTHNDCELGVANTIAALEAGAKMVQGTVNGLGERTGNANLTSVLPIIELKMENRTAVGEDALRQITSVSHFVGEIANIAVPHNLPFVGNSAFAHKGGIHVNALMKDERTYEHMDPAAVGTSRRVLISDLAGKSSLHYKLREFGLEPESIDLKALLARIKELEFEGSQFEGADASLKLLVREFGEHKGDPFEFTGFRVFIDQVSGEFLSEATVKVSVEGSEEHTAADGNGPVHALDRAIKKAVARFFPEVEKIRLIDYKVRVLDAREGTAARVRVLIESTDGIESWSTVGVSHNVIEASWRAIADSILYKLLFLPEEDGTAPGESPGPNQ